MIMKIEGVRSAISYGFEKVRDSDMVHQVEDYRYRPPLLSGGAIVALVAVIVIATVGSTWGAYRAGAKSVRSEFSGRVEALQSRVTAHDTADAKRVVDAITKMRRLTVAEEITSTSHDQALAQLFDRIHKTVPAPTKSTGTVIVATCGTPKKIVQALNK
jgi:hypothetical protein